MPVPLKFIQKGYFPKQIPPSFTTTRLARAIDPTDRSFPLKDATTKLKWTQMMSHSLARASQVRRSLGIPNPCNHWALAKEIAENWNLLREHAKRSPISLSVPTLRRTQGRAAVPAVPLASLMFSRVVSRSSGRHLLRADVAEFYRSVYTHSIPWALHSKATAKAIRDTTLLGNRIDAAVRASQYGQTNGIPIGPDTSLVLAEILLATVDAELEQLIGPLRGYRHHDDYELVFSAAREAEQAKAALQSILLGYGLHLNPLKTELVDLPAHLVSEWWVFVKQFDFDASRDERVKVIEFFEETFQRKREFPNEYVVAYAIGRIEHEALSARAWTVVEPLLHQAVSVEPSAAHKFVRVLIRAEAEGRNVDRDLLAQTIDRLISEHAPYGHASEIAWMLWIALMFKIPLSRDSCAMVSRVSDSIVALLALDAQHRGIAAHLVLQQPFLVLACGEISATTCLNHAG